MTIALLAYMAVTMVGIALLVRWEIRRHRPPTPFEVAMARMRAAALEMQRTIGLAFLPAVRRAAAATVAFIEEFERENAGDPKAAGTGS